MKKSILALTVLAFSSLLQAEDNRRDGNWWRTLDIETQRSYAIGLFDGMLLGHNFSYWGISDEDAEAIPKATKSFYEYSEKYMSHVTNYQIVDGLREFYEDFKNRRTKVNDAVWLVLQQISGTPEEKMKEMIESWRKNAN